LPTITAAYAVRPDRGGERMDWETPSFVEVKMDAEINAYQDDFDREPDDRF
jgi:coenzyme PQQ precursor peptide PqqA